MPEPRTLSLNGEDWTTYWLLPREWEWRRVWAREPPEAVSRRIPAVVPGHAQDALLRAGELPPPYVGLNSRLWEWVSERDWIFEKRFRVPDELAGLRLRLRFEGIDDAAHVFLNGERVGSHEGQLVPVEWDVTDHLLPGSEAHLLVVVEHAAEVQGQIGHTSRERRWKSRFTYGWDWSTRLVPVGLWDSVTLEATGPAWFRTAAAYTNLSEDRSEAVVTVVTELAALERTPAIIVTEIMQAGLPIDTIEDPITVFRSDTSLVQSTVVPRVQLWEPNGSGRPALYQVRLSLFDSQRRLLDRRELEFGVRHAEAVACEGAPPDTLPYCLRVNGRRTWIRGWNWVPLDHLYGSASEERYERLLRLARDANVNLLRVWGGGLLEKELFYRLCDRYGIMVWQEFPLSSSGLDNTPPSDPAYLRYLREQAEAVLARRRAHASLILWCGGNELTGSHLQPLGSEHPALAELRDAVATEDPQRLWLPTSPTGPHFAADPQHRGELHDVHGPWLWLGLIEHPRFYDGIDPLLHSELGCEGAANPEALEYLFGGEPPPPAREDPVWMHHGGNWWLRPESVEAAFGAPGTTADWVRASQLLQALGLQYAVEASRRRERQSAGVLPWQLNEAWPNAVCTNAVDYFGAPKPAYYAVKRAYAPFHVSAAFSTFHWRGESSFSAELWLHNSGPERSLLNVVATILDLDGRELYQESLAAEAPAESAEPVDRISWRFPAEFAEPFLLLLEVVDEEGETIARNAYPHSRGGDEPFARLLSADRTALEAEWSEEGLRLRNSGATPALWVQVSAGDSLIEESHFTLGPRAERLLRVEPGETPVSVTAWNAECVTVSRGAG